MRRLLSVLLLALGLAGVGVPAWAHSGLVEGKPGPADKPQAGLTTITLRFAPLSATGGQRVTVLDPAKRDRVTGVRLRGADTLEVTVEPLAAGVHILTYAVTSADGHPVTGGYYLDVRGGSASASHVPAGLTGLVVTLGVVVVGCGLLLWRAGRRRRDAPVDEGVPAP